MYRAGGNWRQGGGSGDDGNVAEENPINSRGQSQHRELTDRQQQQRRENTYTYRETQTSSNLCPLRALPSAHWFGEWCERTAGTKKPPRFGGDRSNGTFLSSCFYSLADVFFPPFALLHVHWMLIWWGDGTVGIGITFLLSFLFNCEIL